MSNQILQAALDYRKADLSTIPTSPESKKPIVSWKSYQDHQPTEDELRKLFEKSRALGIVTGKVSGNLEIIDFDNKAELYPVFVEMVNRESPGLIKRLLIQKSQSNGLHVGYRCLGIEIPGSTKLSQRGVDVTENVLRLLKDLEVDPNDDTAVKITLPTLKVEVAGKPYAPHFIKAKFRVIITLIETRGERGYFQADPSPGYKLIQGSFSDIPEITAEERRIIIDAARSLNEWVNPNEVERHGWKLSKDTQRPGNDFNERGPVAEILVNHGWELVGARANYQHFRRPGKDRGQSASLIDGKLLYVFSTNAYPFNAEKTYSPFAVYAFLECHGDFVKAAGELQRLGYGEQPKEQKKRTHNFFLVSASQLISEPKTTPRWIWEGILPQGGMSLAVAKPKFGKTTLAINLSVAISRGAIFLGRQTAQAPVIYLALEEKRSEVADMLKSLGVDKEPLFFHFGLAPRKGIEEVELLVTETGAGLLVVDTLQKLARVKDLNDYAQVTNTLEPLLGVARQFNCHILLSHHAGKADRTDGDEVLGSTALIGSVDTAIFLKKRDERRTFSTIQRYGENIPETVLTLAEDYSLSVKGTLAEAKQHDTWERIKTLLAEDPGLTEPEMAERLEIRKAEICSGVGWAIHQNPPLLRREGEGKRGDPFRFFCSPVPAYTGGTSEQKPKTPLSDEIFSKITVPEVETSAIYPGTEFESPNEDNLLGGRFE